MAGNYPSIPEPTGDPKTDLEVLRSLKEAVELLMRQRGSNMDSAVRVQDLVDLGLIQSSQAPT